MGQAFASPFFVFGGERFRAPFTPKPGRMAQSPRLDFVCGWLGCVGLHETIKMMLFGMILACSPIYIGASSS